MLLLASARGEHVAVQSMAELKQQVLVGYDKHTRPSGILSYGHTGNSSMCVPQVDVVEVQMYVEALTGVDQKSRTFGLEGYFRAFWNDPRLAFNSTCINHLAWRSASDVWTPDIYFEQSVKVGLAAPGDGAFLKVAPNGDVSWSRQARLTLRCPMHFGEFPFDAHSCPFKVGLYGSTADEVALQWKPGSDALLNWAKLTNAVWLIPAMSQKNLEEVYSVGTYTYAQAELSIKRRVDGFAIIQPVRLVSLSLDTRTRALTPTLTLALLPTLAGAARLPFVPRLLDQPGRDARPHRARAHLDPRRLRPAQRPRRQASAAQLRGLAHRLRVRVDVLQHLQLRVHDRRQLRHADAH